MTPTRQNSSKGRDASPRHPPPATHPGTPLETFFAKFNELVTSTEELPAIRELILQLAIRGKLVSQASNESVQAQLDRIETFRTERKRKEISAVVEGPFSIPENWAWCAVGDTMEMINGKAFKADEWSTDGTRIIRIQNLNNELAPFNHCRTEVEPRFHVRDGDFLISWSGTPGTSFGAFIWERGFAYLNQHIFLCDLARGVCDKHYLKLAVNARLDEMISHAQGAVGLQHITKGKLEGIALPLPPLAEQKRIVAKVDELMALCDRLEVQLTERESRARGIERAALARFAEAPTPANLELLFHDHIAISPADLRKSILTLAVHGRIIRQNPDDEPVEALLKRNLAERRKMQRTEATEVQPLPAEDALSYEIPETWRWQRLEDILVFGPTNGFSPKAVEYETPVRSLTLSATTSGRFKGEHSKFIATEVPADSDLWLRDGDILVQRGNTIEYVGVAAVYRGPSNCFVYPDLMMKLRVSSAVDVGFIHLAMSHEVARDFLRARASGTSGSMPKINQTTLKSLPLPIPPLAEQRRIVAKVDQLMTLVDKLEAQLTASRTTADHLLSALVAELTA